MRTAAGSSCEQLEKTLLVVRDPVRKRKYCVSPHRDKLTCVLTWKAAAWQEINGQTLLILKNVKRQRNKCFLHFCLIAVQKVCSLALCSIFFFYIGGDMVRYISCHMQQPSCSLQRRADSRLLDKFNPANDTKRRRNFPFNSCSSCKL